MYKQISQIESCCCPSLKMEISVDGPEITEDERNYISRCLDELHTYLRNSIIKRDPDFLERKQIEEEKLLSCFPEPIYVEETTNEYGGLTPWYLVTTKIGRIKIGWRKRVIQIDWLGSQQTLKADQLFPNENVTKACWMIHAWGYDKAKEYISTILSPSAIETWI